MHAIEKGMPFLDARKLLLKDHWIPADHEEIGVENDLGRMNINEVESCAMGQAFCIFNYKKNNKCLKLISKGEEVKDMKVYSWSGEC